MTTARQLYSLQEIDLAIDAINKRRAEAEAELQARLSVSQVEAALEAERAKLLEIQKNHRLEQVEAETIQERIATLERHLFTAGESNPRDLEAMQQEVFNARNQLDRREVRLLELSLQAEESRNRARALEEQLATAQATWETRQAELTGQVKQLAEQHKQLADQRGKMSAGFDAQEMQRYERLRQSKGGQAVARVERGLCQACRMSLPTQHLQRVRSGRQMVLCNNCGRILCAA